MPRRFPELPTVDELDAELDADVRAALRVSEARDRAVLELNAGARYELTPQGRRALELERELEERDR